MPCINYPNKTWVNLTQNEIIKLLILDTQIQKNITKLAVYKLKSRTDKRTSSTIVGLVGSTFVITILTSIVFLDLSSICRCICNKED